ncbi:MAG: DUF554 domain-containing protein [Lachnospiraceae bacterium]|nr:DUF554 domain-containing protein [Lachnospiraceae bacterium]
MPGIGTIINTAAILAGGLLGLMFGKLLPERIQDGLLKANGIAVIFIGISGALQHMLSITGSTAAATTGADAASGLTLTTAGSMMMIMSLTIGTLIGEFADLEGRLTTFGEWLKAKSGNAKDKEFVSAFVTASLTVCIGAMAIVGSIEDGAAHDPSILISKAILDFTIILVMTALMGKGCIFSAIPVALLQGSFTLLAVWIAPLVTEEAMNNLSLVGSILIFCVGLNLIRERKIRVANMLPALIIAAAWTLLG